MIAWHWRGLLSAAIKHSYRRGRKQDENEVSNASSCSVRCTFNGSTTCRFNGLVVMISVLHTEGLQFEPGLNHFYFISSVTTTMSSGHHDSNVMSEVVSKRSRAFLPFFLGRVRGSCAPSAIKCFRGTLTSNPFDVPPIKVIGLRFE